MTDRTTTYWSVVIPVKLLQAAKTRIDAGDAATRSALAAAMALDTIAAVVACEAVAQAVVVTDESEIADASRAIGAVVVDDEPRSGMNAAIEHGAIAAAKRSDRDLGVAALAGDLPALKSAELTTVLAAAAAHDRAVVADAVGTGTVLLTAAPGVALAPEFGSGSLARHINSGAVPLAADAPGLQRDVDTIADLEVAMRHGCGPRTAAVAVVLLRGETETR